MTDLLMPQIGDQVRVKGRSFTAVGHRGYTRKSDGTATRLTVWRVACKVCQCDYEVTTPGAFTLSKTHAFSSIRCRDCVKTHRKNGPVVLVRAFGNTQVFARSGKRAENSTKTNAQKIAESGCSKDSKNSLTAVFTAAEVVQ